MFYCLLDLSCGECNVISLLFCVALSMDPFVLCVACLTVFVNCLVKQFAICLSGVVILLLNVIDLFSMIGGVMLDSPTSVCVVPLIPVCDRILLPYVLFVICMAEGITCVCSPYVFL